MPDLKKHRSFYYLVLIVSAYHFTLAYLFNLPQTQLRAYALGHVPYPFQGRIFMALVFRLSMRWQWLTNFVQHEHKAHISDPLQLVFAASVFVSLIVAAEFVRLGLKSLIGQNLVSTYAGLLVPYMCYFNFLLAPIYLGQLPYDLPGVAFYSIGLWSILRRKWWALRHCVCRGNAEQGNHLFSGPHSARGGRHTALSKGKGRVLVETGHLRRGPHRRLGLSVSLFDALLLGPSDPCRAVSLEVEPARAAGPLAMAAASQHVRFSVAAFHLRLPLDQASGPCNSARGFSFCGSSLCR